MTSQFSPDLFLDMEMNEPTEQRELIPPGDYTAVIGDIKSRSWQKGDKSGIAWDVPLIVDVPGELQTELGLPSTLMFTDAIFLDTNAAGGIDNAKGKNSKLRTYRDALDLNKPGDVFSARKMTGQPILVKIAHDYYAAKDRMVERVKGVTKA